MRLAPRLSRFGIWIVGESLAARFLGCGDNLFVDRFMGVDALGAYRVSCNIRLMIFGLALNRFLTALYPAFSRLQGDLESMKSAFPKVNRRVFP
jgi:O-antigen/teichoic acid export membrane protein